MKLYISADIEGVAGIASPTEADMAQASEYAHFREQMTAETVAACEGAFAAGADEIIVKDAHGTGRNIDGRQLVTPPDKTVQLIRGWSGHPFSMVQGIDDSYQRVAFVGFHSAAGTGGNPLAHTVSGRMFSRVELNDEVASEFMLYGMAAASVGVPLVFLSGDRAICKDAERRIDGIVTVATFEGFGPSVQSLLPDEAVRRIRDGMQRAIAAPACSLLPLPTDFSFRLTFAKPMDAYARSFYPGARQVSDTVLLLESRRYLDILTFLKFAAR